MAKSKLSLKKNDKWSVIFFVALVGTFLWCRSDGKLKNSFDCFLSLFWLEQFRDCKNYVTFPRENLTNLEKYDKDSFQRMLSFANTFLSHLKACLSLFRKINLVILFSAVPWNSDEIHFPHIFPFECLNTHRSFTTSHLQRFHRFSDFSTKFYFNASSERRLFKKKCWIIQL